MSWLFSQAQVAEYLEVNSLDGERYAPLKLTPMPQAFCSKDKMMAYSRLSRYGMTFAPLTDDLGAELLTWFLEDFPVKTSRLREGAPESPENEADSGGKWPEWFAKWDRDMCSWKTPQCSLFGDSEQCSVTWPKWGTMRNGECSARTTPDLRTSESESGFWPTPRSTDGSHGGRITPRKSRNGGNLIEAVSMRMWPNPCSRDFRTGDKQEHRRARNGYHLNDVIAPGGSLNPTWVEWLMGWPLGFSDLKPLEMDKYQQWLELHGMNLIENHSDECRE